MIKISPQIVGICVLAALVATGLRSEPAPDRLETPLGQSAPKLLIGMSPPQQGSRARAKSRTTGVGRRPAEFRRGMSKEDVDDLIKQYKLEYRYDEREHKIDVNLGSFARTGGSSADLHYAIVFGRDGKAVTVKETVVFVGSWGWGWSRQIP